MMKTLNNYIIEKVNVDDLDPSSDNLVRLWKELGIEESELQKLVSNEDWDAIAHKIADTINSQDK